MVSAWLGLSEKCWPRQPPKQGSARVSLTPGDLGTPFGLRGTVLTFLWARKTPVIVVLPKGSRVVAVAPRPRSWFGGLTTWLLLAYRPKGTEHLHVSVMLFYSLEPFENLGEWKEGQGTIIH